MAADDIYEVKANFENPSGNSSFRIYYQEDIPRSGIGTDTQLLAQSWDTAISIALRDVLSDDFLFTSIVASKVDGVPEAKFRVDLATQQGQRSGPALPSNNCLLIGLNQALFGAASNGRIFVPGVAESDTTVGVLNQAFQDNEITALMSALGAQLEEESAGAGRWSLGVISAKVRDVALPAKDWQGAFSTVTSLFTTPIIATQRRRGTDVVGAA